MGDFSSPSKTGLSGSTARLHHKQGVCGLVGFDCADSLERDISHYPATRPCFKDTFIEACESYSHKTYHYINYSDNIRQHVNPKVPTNSTGKSDLTIFQEVKAIKYRSLLSMVWASQYVDKPNGVSK